MQEVVDDGRRVLADHLHVDVRGQSGVEDLPDDIRRLREKGVAGKLLGEFPPERGGIGERRAVLLRAGGKDNFAVRRADGRGVAERDVEVERQTDVVE